MEAGGRSAKKAIFAKADDHVRRRHVRGHEAPSTKKSPGAKKELPKKPLLIESSVNFQKIET